MVSLVIRCHKPYIFSPLYRCYLIRPFHHSISLCTEEKVNAKKSVFLPSTTLSSHSKSTERSRMDQDISESGRMGSLYEWQLKDRERRKTIKLMDGLPYANGTVHTGHTINKILKDFIVESCISRGERVVFRPGWDCHGLPIQRNITKNTQGESAIEHVVLHLSNPDFYVLEDVSERDIVEVMGVSAVEKKKEGDISTLSIHTSSRIRCDRCRKNRRQRGRRSLR
ncbi:hypothetical protein PMAYCL1PPCAC_24038 [Pristionchus mayeri]|uniref:Aminoacyl-tRNA synthetase class Ia domain-containing protein n=1 Tax=Pristionchus mayeri TaxID=1317129 RepID=A0AAN5CZT1_9BILA|nr:hypothetical protein PMAYCL1PPCAC_24038 [Pristionchus mayeri]